MQADLVAACLEFPENILLAAAGGFEQRENLVAVTGEHNVIERHGWPISKGQSDARFAPLHREMIYSCMDSAPVRRSYGLQVALAAASNCPPHWVSVDAEHAVIFEE